MCSKIRGKRGEGKGKRGTGRGREGIKERWKLRLAGAGQGFFLLRQRCIIYRRWWRQAASDGAEQRRRAAPFSFVGLFPVGRLCAGWMAAFEETQASIELRVKAGHDLPALRHSNTRAPQCLSLLWPERKRKGRRESDRVWGEIVGVFDFGRGKKKEKRKRAGEKREVFFCGENGEIQKEIEGLD